MPVGNGGKFTAEAGAVYELVLQMQKVRLQRPAKEDKLTCCAGRVGARQSWHSLG